MVTLCLLHQQKPPLGLIALCLDHPPLHAIDASALLSAFIQLKQGDFSVRLPLDWTAQEPSELAIASNTLACLAQRLDVDTIQLHTPALVAQSAWHAPVLAVVHSCVGTWWRAVRGNAPPDDFLWRLDAVHAGLAIAHVVVAPSHSFADLVRATYDLQREIAVVHNGRASQAHTLPTLITDSCGALAVGRLWDEGKNVTLLDQAAAHLHEIPIMAAGAVDGPNGAHLNVDRPHLLGVLSESEIAMTLRKARIFVSPSLYEPFGLAVLEAAAAGLPLVLSDIPTFRELWDDAAVFLSPRDVEGWAQTLDVLHADLETCGRWGMRARERAADYTIERFEGAMWEKHCHLLSAVASPGAAAA